MQPARSHIRTERGHSPDQEHIYIIWKLPRLHKSLLNIHASDSSHSKTRWIHWKTNSLISWGDSKYSHLVGGWTYIAEVESSLQKFARYMYFYFYIYPKQWKDIDTAILWKSKLFYILLNDLKKVSFCWNSNTSRALVK